MPIAPGWVTDIVDSLPVGWWLVGWLYLTVVVASYLLLLI